MPTRRRRWTLVALLLLAAIAVAAGATAYAVMRSVVGLTNDSRAYLSLASGMETRAAGAPIESDDILSRRFPPLYPAILALIDGATGIGLTRAARLLNVACLIASTLLVARVVWEARRSARRALLAAALFAVATDAINTHVHLWSEPTFGIWMLLGTLALARYLRGGGTRRWLLAAALFAACAILTRYAGAALVLAEALTILFCSPRPRRRERFADSVVFGLVPALALLLWALAVPQQGAGIGQRDVTLAWIGWAKLDQGLSTFGTWIAWNSHALNLARVTGALALAVFVALLARRRRAVASPVLALPWAFCCVYPPFLLVSITFADPATPLDVRILAPLHTMAILLACATLGTRLPAAGSAWARRLTTGVVAALLAAQVASMAGYLGGVRQTGLGYASLRWREQQTIRAAAQLPEGVPIFATHRVAVQLITGLFVQEVPFWPDDAPPPRSYDAAALGMLDALREAGGRGYLIYLRRPPPPANKHYLTAAQLKRYVRVQQIANLPDGRIYKILGIVNDVRHAPTTVPTTAPTDARPRAEPDDSEPPTPAGPASPTMPDVD